MSLVLNNLSFIYDTTPLICRLSATFPSSKVTVIQGENGSGKTTLSKLCMGILKPCSGRISLFGKSLSTMNLASIGQEVYYTFQNPEKQLFCDSVFEELTFALKYRGLPFDDVDNILEKFHLQDFKDQYPLSLSSGQKQRLALACGFILKPKMYILDEPTANLDLEQIQILISLIKEEQQRGAGMVIFSHDFSFSAEVADIIYELKGGCLHEKS